MLSLTSLDGAGGEQTFTTLHAQSSAALAYAPDYVHNPGEIVRIEC